MRHDWRASRRAVRPGPRCRRGPVAVARAGARRRSRPASAAGGWSAPSSGAARSPAPRRRARRGPSRVRCWI
ncbi:MAG: hypothetical protein EOM91_20790 [Sphingobacteriia bacterium]|nr:hypothetical protein [Sphingobacteriia bacterium]